MKKQKEIHTIYKTDDIEQARLVTSKSKNVSVVYHNPNKKIPPILTFKINGKSYTKLNPEYVEYLKKKYPGISDDKISKCINEAMAESLSEKENLSQLNSSKKDKIEAHNTTKNVRKK